MAGPDVELFMRLGLCFGSADAERLAKTLRKGCLLLGVAMGAGLAIVGISDLGKAGKGQAVPKSMAFAMIAAGFGLGFLTVTGVCKSIELKIDRFLQQFATTEAAIAALTPTKRAELMVEAIKLLALADKIDKVYEEEHGDSRFTSSA